MCLNKIIGICKNIIEEEDKMKNKKIIFMAFSLAIFVLAIGCTTNDTGLNNTRDRLSTQTRINRDWNFNNDMGMDNLDTRFNDGTTNNLNNGMVRNNNNLNNTNNQNTKANKLANEIAKIPEVEDATVVLNNDSCIVGVELNNNNNNNNNISASLRNRIEKIVKKLNNIPTENISITADPDLLDRITDLSENMADTVGNDFKEFTNDIEDLINDITGVRRVR